MGIYSTPSPIFINSSREPGRLINQRFRAITITLPSSNHFLRARSHNCISDVPWCQKRTPDLLYDTCVPRPGPLLQGGHERMCDRNVKRVSGDWSGFISAAGNLWCSRGGSSVTGADSTDWNRSFFVEARLRPSLHSGPSNFREESPYNDSHRKNPTAGSPVTSP
jgi:hypothetical protein